MIHTTARHYTVQSTVSDLSNGDDCVVLTFEQEVTIADLGDWDLLDAELGRLARRVNRARREVWHATYLSIVEGVHGSRRRHGDFFGWRR